MAGKNKNQILKENPLLDKIKDLKEKLFGADAGDHAIVDEWNKAAKQALITANLQKHEAIQMIIEKVEGDIAEIDDVLTTAASVDLPDSDRDRMLDVKKFYQWFLDLFTTAQSTISEIDDAVENQLKD